MAPGAFRVGLVGAGGISNAHVAAARASGGRVEIAGVADVLEANRRRVAAETGATPFESAKAMFQAHARGLVRLDGVVVCTPPSARVDIVRGAIKAGLAVLSEKPLAHTLSDAKKVAALAKRHKKSSVHVAYCHRFAPAVNLMKRLVAEGKIGRLVRFENFFACDLPGHREKWFSDPRRSGGGALLDMGSHSVDLFHYLVGPAKVVGSVLDHSWKGRAETAGTVLLKSTKKGAKETRGNVPKGVPGVIVSGWAETCRFTLALVGNAGMLHYDYERPTELVFKDLGGKSEVLPVASHEERFARQLVAFADAVQKVRSDEPGRLASASDGLAASAVNDAGARKAKKG